MDSRGDPDLGTVRTRISLLNYRWTRESERRSMGYQEFLCVVEKNMNQKLEGGVTASIQVTMKNNGKIKQGILVEDPRVNISPTIYLESFYEKFQEGESMDEILNGILKVYESIRYKTSWNTRSIVEFEQVKSKIVFKLVNQEKNRKLLEQVPHRDVLDLSLVFYVLLDLNAKGTASMLILNEHLESWGVEEQELYPLACENVMRLLPARFFAMKDLVNRLMAEGRTGVLDLLEHPEYLPKDMMYVLTNPESSYGAATIMYPGVLEHVGMILKESFFILPSSIHEVILVPVSQGMTAEELSNMVCEVNDSQVEYEEQLSDHVYYYSWEKKVLEQR